MAGWLGWDQGRYGGKGMTATNEENTEANQSALDRLSEFGTQTHDAQYNQAKKGPKIENDLWSQSRGLQNTAAVGAMGVADMYRNAAQGNGPSAAQAQLQQGVAQASASQMSMANSTRGGAQAQMAARRAAMQNAGQMQAGVANQAAQLRAQEQQAAMQGYAGAVGMQGQLAGQMRAGDAELRGSNMQWGMQNAQMANQFNRDQAQQNQQQQQYFEGLRHQATMGDLDAQNTQRALSIQQQEGNANRKAGAQVAQFQATAGMIGAMTGGFKSDVRMKENISPADQRGIAQMYAQAEGMKEATPSESMLRQLRPYSYNYKPESGEDPNRRQFGIMAQDLERSEMGKSLVHDTSQGKVIDAGKGVGVALAATSDLQKQIDELRAGVAQYGSNPPAVKGRY